MSSPPRSGGVALRRVLLEMTVICAVALAVGLSLNYRMVMNAFTGKTVAPPMMPVARVTTVAFPDPVELDEVRQLLEHNALLVDARHSEDFRQAHLAGAVSLPLGEVAQHLETFRATVPLDRVLVLYCNGFGCPDSFDLGVLLLQSGYQQVRVFEGGFPEWRDAGLPLAGESR